MAAADSEEEEEDLVCFGTPLEPLEEGERIKKPVPLQEQTVRDEKGRYKRFHGAFSGGFSAGYFNTVGSKEGWAPSTFVSSRQNKAEKTVLGPEDFMDEEDLGEHGIAPKEITISDVFASKSKDKIQEKARQIAGAAAPIPGATVLDEFIAPAKITIGIDLLQKMGWKEGQGIGPRVKRKPRKQKPEPGVKIYGCALPPGSEESEDEDDEYRPENVTFAPKDVIPVDLTPKENVHGLGYKGLDPTKALFGTSQQHLNLFNPSSGNTDVLDKLQHSKGRKLGISGQAFGVGALEEEDDDIYATESLSRYDTVLKDEEPGDGLYGWTAPKQYKSKQDKELGFQKSKGSEKEVRYIGKILDGFSLASTPMNSQIKIYPPPDLPKDYRPVHYFRPVIKASSENTHLVQALAESTGKLESDIALHSRHQKTASQRREMLGETSLQGPTTSVLEYLSDKDKERIRGVKQLAEQQVKIPELSQQPVHNQLQAPAWPTAPQTWQLHLGAQLATAGSGDFKPFAKDPEKQKRYEGYIDHLKHGKKDTLESCFDQSMTEWERRREQEEFSRSAQLYKSSSSVLSSRFIAAKLEDDTDRVEVPRDLETDVTDKEAAAKMKMFGQLTREKLEWHPDKLLCKRFNVPDPYSESCIVGLPKVKRDKYSVFNFLTVSESSPKALSQPTSTEIQLNSALSKPKKPSRWDVSDQDKKKKDAISKFISLARSKVDVQDQQSTPANAKDKDRITEAISNEAISETIQPSDLNEEEEESRPSMDLFKAIFASSSDEKSSSSEEESDGEEQLATVPEPVAEPMELPDLLGSPLPDEQESEDITPEPPLTATTSSKEIVDEGEEFGPRLPPAVSDTLLKHGDLQPTSSPEATRKEKPKKSKEKHKPKREHKHKKEKKKKHKKHKHKGKHKSKKSEKNSGSDTGESSDGNSDEEITDISPQELLKRLKRNLPVAKQ